MIRINLFVAAIALVVVCVFANAPAFAQTVPVRSGAPIAVVNQVNGKLFLTARVDIPPGTGQVTVYRVGQEYAPHLRWFDFPSGLQSGQSLELPATMPGVDGEVRVLVVLNPNTPTAVEITRGFPSEDEVVQPLPARDQSLEMLKTQWLPFAWAVVSGFAQVSGLRDSLLVLGETINPDGEVRGTITLVNQEPKARGVGLVVQTSFSGEVLRMDWLTFLNGLGRGQKVHLPVKEFGRGSGKIFFIYFPQEWKAPGNEPALLSLLVNYPLFGAQPNNNALEIMQRSFRGGENPGYEYVLNAAGNVAVSADGLALRGVWRITLADSDGYQGIFIPLNDIGIARVVEITFCSQSGDCISDTLVPRVRPFKTPMRDPE